MIIHIIDVEKIDKITDDDMVKYIIKIINIRKNKLKNN
jgi:hypothetical protein